MERQFVSRGARTQYCLLVNRVEDLGATRELYDHAVAAVVRRCWKHSRQKTGRPCVGLNGTVVSFPQPEQVVRVSTRGLDPVEVGPSEEVRLVLHALQRLGSFLNCLSWKNSCSPAVKTKSAPQSIHFRTLSWYSMETNSLQPATPKAMDGDLLTTAGKTGLSILANSRKFQCSGTTPGFGPPRECTWSMQ